MENALALATAVPLHFKLTRTFSMGTALLEGAALEGVTLARPSGVYLSAGIAAVQATVGGLRKSGAVLPNGALHFSGIESCDSLLFQVTANQNSIIEEFIFSSGATRKEIFSLLRKNGPRNARYYPQRNGSCVKKQCYCARCSR